LLSLYLFKTSSVLAAKYLKLWSVRALESFYLVEKRVMNMEEAEQPGMEMTVREPGVTVADTVGEHGRREEGWE